MIKQTNAQALGNKGEQWFPAQLPKYWLFQKPTYDLGVDGVVVITEQNQFNGLEFRVQIKSSSEWKLKDGAVILGGIKRTTARYWAAGSSPTLLVFYDESENRGYYAWALDALPQISDLLLEKSKTITIRARSPSVIDSECWNKIRSDLALGIEYFSETINTGGVANIVFPQIRDIARCLQLLHLAEFTTEPDDTNQQLLLRLSQALAHRDIIQASHNILDELHPECLFARQLHSTIESYKSRVSEFYLGFDDLLQKPYETIAIRENPEKSKELRPEMIRRTTELLLLLTGLGNAESNSQKPNNGMHSDGHSAALHPRH